MKDNSDTLNFIQHDVNLYFLDVTGEKKDEILNALKLKDHIQRMIEKCKREKQELENDGVLNIAEQHLSEERYEHLDNLQTKLQFMLDHTGEDQCV